MRKALILRPAARSCDRRLHTDSAAILQRQASTAARQIRDYTRASVRPAAMQRVGQIVPNLGFPGLPIGSPKDLPSQSLSEFKQPFARSLPYGRCQAHSANE